MFAAIRKRWEKCKKRKRCGYYGERAGYYEVTNFWHSIKNEDWKSAEIDLSAIVSKYPWVEHSEDPMTEGWRAYVDVHSAYERLWSLEEVIRENRAFIIYVKNGKTRIFVESPGNAKAWTRQLKWQAKAIARHEREKRRAKRQGQAKVKRLREKAEDAKRKQEIAERKAAEYNERANRAEKLLKE